jgi:glycosyltransferase involved in cell wall biosynthesis
MRIAIIAGSIPSTTFIDALINGLAERGYSITVIGKKIKPCSYAKNVNTIEIPSQRISQLLFIGVNLWKMPFHQILRIYKNSNSLKLAFFDYLYYLPLFMAKPDKVHIQWAADLYKKELLFDLFRNKIILSLRGSHINYTPIIKPKFGEFYKKVFPKVHKFHAVSNAIAKLAITYGADENRIHIIYSSVDDSILQQPIVKKTEKKELSMIAVGRFHWIKGYHYLIDALGMARSEGTEFKLILISGSNIPEEINFNIHQQNLLSQIKIINNLPHVEVLKLIAKADVLILPSLDEGIANVIIESMAVGTPVISSNCGGMPEVIVHGFNGLLYENRDALDLAKKITEFNNLNILERANISIKAKETVQHKFTRSRMLDQYIQVYS